MIDRLVDLPLSPHGGGIIPRLSFAEAVSKLYFCGNVVRKEGKRSFSFLLRASAAQTVALLVLKPLRRRVKMFYSRLKWPHYYKDPEVTLISLS